MHSRRYHELGQDESREENIKRTERREEEERRFPQADINWRVEAAHESMVHRSRDEKGRKGEELQEEGE